MAAARRRVGPPRPPRPPDRRRLPGAIDAGRGHALRGVNANRVIATAFLLSGLLAGTAAVLLIGQTGSVSPSIGLPPLLIGLVAVVIGGLGGLPGAVLGAYILGAASVALQAGLPVDARPFRDAFLFGLVIVILTLRPQGIVARKVRV